MEDRSRHIHVSVVSNWWTSFLKFEIFSIDKEKPYFHLTNCSVNSTEIFSFFFFSIPLLSIFRLHFITSRDALTSVLEILNQNHQFETACWHFTRSKSLMNLRFYVEDIAQIIDKINDEMRYDSKIYRSFGCKTIFKRYQTHYANHLFSSTRKIDIFLCSNLFVFFFFSP